MQLGLEVQLAHTQLGQTTAASSSKQQQAAGGVSHQYQEISCRFNAALESNQARENAVAVTTIDRALQEAALCHMQPHTAVQPGEAAATCGI
jgi:hypothetical protein